MSTPAAKPQLGAFIGVFTPTVLTILGVIMFLRMGWVVANAGWVGAIAIVLLANAITLVTTLSMSALATNMRVGVGGAYFLISRSFGLEMGGAVGIPLYLSQVLSLTLYSYGLAESVRFVWAGMPDILVPVLAASIVIGVSAIASKSIELTLRLQLPIMVLIFGAILSLLAGVDFNGPQVPWGAAADSPGFFQVFAVFFPAVTGILAGVSLSGDLEDPGTAIPKGALTAVLLGTAVYIIIPIALANGADATALKGPLVWTQIAAVPLLVMPGLWGAILSSAFGSILGAPRTLQALAEDRLVPVGLAELDEKTGEPVFGLYVSAGIALFACLLGNLNAVASVVTMFFLTTYGTLNLVTFLETVTGDPAFRPRIKVPWWLSLGGGVSCFGTMFLIDWKAGVLALVVEAILFYALSRRSFEATWGDVRGGLWMTAARYALMNLRHTRFEPRNWRPHLLLFTRDLAQSLPVIRLADLLGQHRGIVTVCTLLEGDIEDHDQASELVALGNRLLEEQGLVAFCEATCVPDIDQGVLSVAQANGMAGLQSNTAMFGYRDSDGAELLQRYLVLARKLSRLEMCTLIYRPGVPTPPMPRPQILVWWKGRQNNGDLMLLLAHLIKLTPEWQRARIILQTVVETEDEAVAWRSELLQMMPDIRIDLETRVTVRPPEVSAREIIRSESATASLVLLGMALSEPGGEVEMSLGLAALVEGMPNTLLVRNEGPFRGRLV